MNGGRSPRDRYVTLWGRKPVLEALRTPWADVEVVHVATNATGPTLAEVLRAASEAGARVERVPPRRVTEVAGTERHQGVAADVRVPDMADLTTWIDRRSSGRRWRTRALLLDRVHNPANVGLVLRTAVAAGLDGVIVPTAGTATLGPQVVKASAGVALRAPIVRAHSPVAAVTELAEARFTIAVLDPSAPVSLFEAPLPERVVAVVGNETTGVEPGVLELADVRWAIPLAGGVESLNVATAAALVAFELMRR